MNINVNMGTGVDQALTAVTKVFNAAQDVDKYASTRSLSDVTKMTRVEPLTILSKDLLNLEYMPDVTSTMLNLFAAYYLQAISILTKVNNVEVVRILDRLNPNRDNTAFLQENNIGTLSLENYKYRLPTSQTISMEADDKINLNEAVNLAVGKLLNVSICVKGMEKAVELPISVRLMTSVVPDSTILQLLTTISEDNTFTERWHAWRAGRIGFIKDLIFCNDLIDEWKKASIGDNTDTVQEVLRRVNNSKKYGLMTKNPSLVSASNLFIISEQNARAAEAKLGGRFTSSRIRDKAFENTYAMVIAIVDREYERVTFYIRGNHTGIDLSIKEIKAASKGKGPDIMEIFKSMSIGAPTVF